MPILNFPRMNLEGSHIFDSPLIFLSLQDLSLSGEDFYIVAAPPRPSRPADLQLPPTHPGPDPRRAVVCRRVWLVSQVTGWSLVRQTDTSISQRPVSQPLHCAVPPGWRLGSCCGRVWENRDTSTDFEKKCIFSDGLTFNKLRQDLS